MNTNQLLDCAKIAKLLQYELETAHTWSKRPIGYQPELVARTHNTLAMLAQSMGYSLVTKETN